MIFGTLRSLWRLMLFFVTIYYLCARSLSCSLEQNIKHFFIVTQNMLRLPCELKGMTKHTVHRIPQLVPKCL